MSGKPVHGDSYPPTVEYSSWNRMMMRCYNPNNPSFANYGGKGIQVCDEWHIYDNFIRDMGYRPEGKSSLGRKDHNKGYFKDNCEWQTTTKQNRNKYPTKLSIKKAREVRWLWNHTSLTQQEIARKFGVTQACIWKIISNKTWKEG